MSERGFLRRKVTGSLFPFVRHLVLFHLFHFGDWDLCFFPVSWELFDFESGQYRIDNRCARFFTFCVQGSHWHLISPFLAFSVLLAFLFRFCFSAG